MPHGARLSRRLPGATLDGHRGTADRQHADLPLDPAEVRDLVSSSSPASPRLREVSPTTGTKRDHHDDQPLTCHDSIERPDAATSANGELSPEAKTFNWLLDSFTSSTAGVLEAIAVSSDGLLMAMSAIKDRSNAERLAAVVSGMTSLAGGAASWYALGGLNRVIVDMADGYLLVTSISSGSVLGVIADRSANLGTSRTR